MEEEGLSQRDAVDWIVQIVTLIQLHLDRPKEGIVVKLQPYQLCTYLPHGSCREL